MNTNAKKPFVRIALWCAAIQVALLVPWNLDAQEQPNILWINAEDMSPHLGCYGHPNAKTPYLDELAERGIVYRNAFATAPICSPARSCLATGLYATSLGTQHLRCEIELPNGFKPLANRLRDKGYFCTNSGKADYNFPSDGIWDAWNNKLTPWEDREENQPFFSFVTIGETHEGRINFETRYNDAIADLPASFRHDPQEVVLPPFYPDTPKIREIFARMHDLASVFDQKVGTILAALEASGDDENTIVFVFGDHGNGLPRYKRWLTDSGLRVPLIVYVPPKFQHLAKHQPGSRVDQLISFVDFPATALSLAEIPIPDLLQGKAFLGDQDSPSREFVYGARSRADDMFEVSRSVSDGRYLYVRHFLPHRPYIQNSVIFDDRKETFRELRQLHLAGRLSPLAEQLWAKRKPVEELYDLRSDPHETKNLAESRQHQDVKKSLESTLFSWILSHRDSGFLPEAEYQKQARQANISVYEYVQDEQQFDLDSTLKAAARVGIESVSESDALPDLTHPEVGVRYWSAVALQARDELSDQAILALSKSLYDESESVRIAAAEAIIHHRPESDAAQLGLYALAVQLKDDRPWLSLEAARAIANLGSKAAFLDTTMMSVLESNLAPEGSPRRYKNFNYASFTGWALEVALVAVGRQDYVEGLDK